MTTIEARVARGAAWLDEKYPGWFNVIDLGTLKLSDCHQCILGQVYTQHVPEQEKDQLIAQVVGKATAGLSAYDRADWERGMSLWGGYSVLIDSLGLPDGGKDMGFMADYDDPTYYTNQYEALLDEWTRVILEARLRAHPDLNDLTCSLVELREPAVVG